MRILQIKNLKRKDVPIYYRRLYSGTVVLELISPPPTEVPLDFQIEQKPTGVVEIGITLLKKIDYPLVPLQKELKKFIADLDSTGQLPT